MQVDLALWNCIPTRFINISWTDMIWNWLFIKDRAEFSLFNPILTAYAYLKVPRYKLHLPLVESTRMLTHPFPFFTEKFFQVTNLTNQRLLKTCKIAMQRKDFIWDSSIDNSNIHIHLQSQCPHVIASRPPSVFASSRAAPYALLSIWAAVKDR